MPIVPYTSFILVAPPIFQTTATMQRAASPVVNRLFTGGVAFTGLLSTQLSLSTLMQTWMNNIWILRLFPTIDYPGRLQMMPERLFEVDYGNIDQDWTDPFCIVNTFKAQTVLTNAGSIGALEGAYLTAPSNNPPKPPPNPPKPNPIPASIAADITIPPLGCFYFDFIIDSEYELSTIRHTRRWNSVMGMLQLRLLAQRYIVITKEPDWKEQPPDVEHSVESDTFTSDFINEQRTTAYAQGENRITIKARYKVHGLEEGVSFWNHLHRARSRRIGVPFYQEQMVSAVDAAGLTSVPMIGWLLSNLTYIGLEVIRFDPKNPSLSEIRKVVSIDTGTNSLVVDQPFVNSIHPSATEFYMIVATCTEKVSRSHGNDEHHIIDAEFKGV